MSRVLPSILPLLAALVYVSGALFLKRAAELGAGTWRIAWTCNLTAAVVFAPLVLMGGRPVTWQHLWQPAVVALLFVLGQILTFRSLRIGDVSVATPVLGLKVVLVAALTVLVLRQPITLTLWIAAFLASAAIALLNATGQGAHHRVGATIILASLAATVYALFDVLVQQWSSAWGPGRFLPITMGFVALYSLPIRSLARDRSSQLPNPGKWLIGGAICLAVQSIMFVSSIAVFGQAAMANVLYSSRGLWSVLAVWFIGHWFHSRELRHGWRVFAGRLLGAGLLLTAILLVLLQG